MRTLSKNLKQVGLLLNVIEMDINHSKQSGTMSPPRIATINKIRNLLADEQNKQPNVNPSVLTIPIHYWVDDDGVKHIDYDLIAEKYEEEMFKLRTLNIDQG